MVNTPFFQQWKTQLILTSLMLAGTSISVSATVLEDTDTLHLTNQTHTQSSRQIAQAATTVYPTLGDGSTGETVSRLQATLKLLGFYQGEVDGIYNQLTQQAVVSFQNAVDLSADGITGPATWSKLLPAPNEVVASSAEDTDTTSPEDTDTTSVEVSEDPAPEQTATDPNEASQPILQPSAEGPAVSQLQRDLQTLGYYDSTIDGKYGELTEVAVRAFQADQQLTVDAIVGPFTWAALASELEN